jgi:hypothetical protein
MDSGLSGVIVVGQDVWDDWYYCGLDAFHRTWTSTGGGKANSNVEEGWTHFDHTDNNAPLHAAG